MTFSVVENFKISGMCGMVYWVRENYFSLGVEVGVS